MEDNVEDLMNKLEGYIISCGNIVTYKWISQEWNIHVNTAKQLLFTFVKKERSKKNPVNLEVTYFLSGSMKDNNEEKSYQVSLVREKDLSKVKSKMKTIFSEHVYSVQKYLKDFHDIYIVDKVNAQNVINGQCGKAAVKCEAAIQRSTEALDKLRLNAALSTPSSTKVEASLGKKVLKDPKVVDVSSKGDTCKNEEATMVVNGKVKKDDKKGIAGMFAAQSVKNLAKKSDGDSENVNRQNSKNIIQKPMGQKNGIANLFAKQAERPPAQKVKKEEPKKKVETTKKVIDRIEVEEEEDPFASEDEVDHRREAMIDEERRSSYVKVVEKEEAVKKEKIRKKKMKRLVSSGGEEESPLPKKKRRRIKMMSSSEGSSEEEMEVGESESPIPDSPKAKSKVVVVSDDDDDVIPATPSESISLGHSKKRRKRTMVNRTFMDEQGYVVTKKEYVFVSCSDDTSQSGDDVKTKESKPNSKVENSNKICSSEEIGKEKMSKTPVNNDSEATSKEKGTTNEKKNNETEKGKKNGKKFSPSNVRQGVLTSFFKRS